MFSSAVVKEERRREIVWARAQVGCDETNPRVCRGSDGATILLVAGNFGMPVSTTHAITTSIMGVGMAKNWKALDLIAAERIIWAWIFTIPVTGALAYGFFRVLHLVISG
jgi:phosphate/sulfate permease